MKTIRCVLKNGKERPVINRHPWIFSGAIDFVEDGYETGDLVRVFSAREKFLGVGYFNGESQITIRMLAFEDVKIDAEFFEKRITQSIALRNSQLPLNTNAYRLIHSEGDFLPGLTVDVYGDVLVAEFNTAGIDLWKNEIVSAFKKHFPSHAIFERSDSDLRIREGLETSIGVLTGEDVSEKIEVLENGLRFFVDVNSGQKTGFFLDQRDNRAIAGKLAKNKKVLNAFAYTGGFSVYAAAGGAKETVSVDISESAIELGKKIFEANGMSSERNKWIKANVFEFLRKDESEFDFIVLDPPAFCKHKAQTNQAARGYKDINLQAIKKMAPGGLLFTFSCSSFISADLFQKIIFSSASDAKRDVRILRKTSHPFDHPINIYHPEGEYLKGLLCEVL